ncbi:hypothetical protein MNB_SUP05-SYMBIONT-4-728 [hydrothermal vent metagenome]|uniref:Thoeris protein ThsB TIR-like domain-containing protein n=1 Tax=hydrothermal vent metagenome TaxID=652676 RepID=A0A1W1DZE4_9ZZZZ|nr:TIR-like domain-containing protein [Gammaproteobacteria bacterium]
MRRVFFSFDWDNDVWRVNQVRNSWVAKGSYQSAGFEDKAKIERLKLQTDQKIKQWIDKQIHNTSVTCVLIGNQTSNSKWVQYEIEKSIDKGNGILGIYIHSIKDQKRETSRRGKNPLSVYTQPTSGSKKIGNAVVAGGGFGLLARLIFPPAAVVIAVAAGAYQLTKDDDEVYNSYFWIDDNGRENLGDWIELAAQQVGR